MVVDELDKLRQTSTGCHTVAFADLSTQMILVTDTQSNLRREALDALCRQAAANLGTARPVLGTHPAGMAVVTTRSAVRLFMRATDEPNDVLCCVCTPDVDVSQFIVDATACLERISKS